MKSLSQFFAYIWSLISSAFSRITAVSAALATAVSAVVAFFQSIVSGIGSIAETFNGIAQSTAQAIQPFSSGVVGNQWFMIISYTGNLDGLFGVIGTISTAIVTIFSVLVSLTAGFLVLYAGFILLSYILRILKGATASFIDFN